MDARKHAVEGPHSRGASRLIASELSPEDTSLNQRTDTTFVVDAPTLIVERDRPRRGPFCVREIHFLSDDGSGQYSYTG